MTSAHVAKAREAMPRIGYLGTSVPTAEAFREGLRKLGYIEGQNIIIEYRWGRGHADELAATHAADLVRLDLDLIVAANSTYVPPLGQVSGTIPIIFCISTDPVAEGIVTA